jgi:hypothetical protein
LAAKNVTNPKGRAGCIVISAVICVAALIEYVVRIQREYADVSDITVLALLPYFWPCVSDALRWCGDRGRIKK